MDYNYVKRCSYCKQTKSCNDVFIRKEDRLKLVSFCKECYEEIIQVENVLDINKIDCIKIGNNVDQTSINEYIA